MERKKEGRVKIWLQSMAAAFRITRGEAVILAVLLFLGGLLRLAGIEWGITHIFQADEGKLVRPAIEMAKEMKLYHDSYGYPDQFISKFAAVFIWLYARMTGTVISNGMIQAYFIYRSLVAFLSTGCIATAYLIGNRLRKRTGIILASLVAFFPPYVNYAKQVTGDINVLFFSTLVILVSFFYLENGRKRELALMTLFAAMAVLEKWHGGSICFYIACIVIWRERKNIKRLISRGLVALAGFVIWIALLAPNMIWNIRGALEGFGYMYSYDLEGEVTGIWRCFIDSFFSHGGLLGTIAVMAGIVWVCRSREEKYLCILAGLLNWGIMSLIMNRIFERWGLSFYFTMLILLALGLRMFWDSGKAGRAVGVVISAVVLVTYLCGSMRYVLLATRSNQDTRLVGESLLWELGITTENSIYDYFSSFSPGGIRAYENGNGEKGTMGNDYILLHDGEVYVTKQGCRYAVTSSYAREDGDDQSAWELLEENAPEIARLDSEVDDLFFSPGGKGSALTIEPVNCKRLVDEIRRILRGDYMGPTLIIYDISGLPVYDGGEDGI